MKDWLAFYNSLGRRKKHLGAFSKWFGQQVAYAIITEKTLHCPLKRAKKRQRPLAKRRWSGIVFREPDPVQRGRGPYLEL